MDPGVTAWLKVTNTVPDGPAVPDPEEPSVKFTPLLCKAPTITTTFPVVASGGTTATIDVGLQLVIVVVDV
jgi:hypothetical protein